MIRRRRSPSPAPSEWATGPPDFVGVGAQRSGTTWWFNLIAAHPGVAIMKTRGRGGRARKEHHYFDRFAYTPFDAEAIRRYHDLFPRPANRMTGEWTPRYMDDFWTPPCLARAVPNAKLLVLLRDPIERYRAGLSFNATRIRGPKHAAMMQLAHEALRRGLYFEQLTRLLEHFDRSQMLVLQYERCTVDPVSELRRTYQFLALDPPDHVPRSIHDRFPGRFPGQRAELSEEWIAILKDRMATDVKQLARTFPEIDPALWPHFRPGER